MTDNNAGAECACGAIPLIGEEAPSFVADSTQGIVKFPEDYEGKWVILFSHPADFTPVCTSEIATFGALAGEFRALNTELIGISVDSICAHVAWLKNIQEKIRYHRYNGQPIDFPIVADVKMDVARKYGMIQPSSSDTKAVRAVFFIDPAHRVRALIYYPLSNGRNFEEIKRLLLALQTTDKFGVSTPADWEPGDEVLVAAPSTMSDLKKREGAEEEGAMDCQDWFFCRKKLGKAI